MGVKDGAKDAGSPAARENTVKSRSSFNGSAVKGTNSESILVLSAHSDDFVLGAGGAIAKYAKEGRRVTVFVFSYGEKSHPWLKRRVIRKIRSEEAYHAGRILGCSVKFFDLPEFGFMQDSHRSKAEEQLLKFIHRTKPAKIFTHSSEDPHPDHHAVSKIAAELYGRISLLSQTEVYSYSVWNPVSFRTQYPAMYVDISNTFRVKLRALREFRSQRIHIVYPIFLLLYKAVKDGWHIRRRFGEHFFRVK